MKKKQLHIVNKYFYPVQAGIETCILETYSSFNKDVWDITIHTSANTLNDVNTLASNATIRDLRVVRYKTFRGIFFPVLPWNEEGVIVIYNFSLVPILPILLCAFFLKLIGRKKSKLVFAPHGGFTPKWEVFTPLQRSIKKVAHMFFGKPAINYSVDWIHSVALWEKEQLIKEGINEKLITVIRNGVEEAGFIQNAVVDQSVKDLVKQSGKYLVIIGRIHPIKNVHVAIKALTHIPADVNLLILGQVENGEYERSLHALVKDLQLEKRVKFAGTIRGANKFYVIKQAVAQVHPSMYEVDPLVIKEAFSQGTICIGANNTGTSRLIIDSKNGFLVPTGDSVKLAERVNFVLEHPENSVLAAIKKYTLEHREELRWKNIAHKIEQHFLKL